MRWGFGVKAAGSNLPWLPRLLIFCVLMDNNHQPGTPILHRSNFKSTNTPFTRIMAPANVPSLSNHTPIRMVYSPHPSSVSPQHHIATQEEDHDWQPGKLRRPVTHLPISVKEGYLLLAFPPSSSSSSLPPYLNPLLLSTQWSGNLTIPHSYPALEKKRQK